MFGFRSYTAYASELQAWLLPVALTTANGLALTRMLRDEVRQRRIIVPSMARSGYPVAVIERIIGWHDLATEVACCLVRPDPVKLFRSNAPILRQIGPASITAIAFGAVPACTLLSRAVSIIRDLGSGRLRKLPTDVSLGFVRAACQQRVDRAGLDRRTFEFCVLPELRDRLHAGDMWVEVYTCPGKW